MPSATTVTHAPLAANRCRPLPAPGTCVLVDGRTEALGGASAKDCVRVLDDRALAGTCWRDGEWEIGFGDRCDFKGGLCSLTCAITCNRDGSPL